MKIEKHINKKSKSHGKYTSYVDAAKDWGDYTVSYLQKVSLCNFNTSGAEVCTSSKTFIKMKSPELFREYFLSSRVDFKENLSFLEIQVFLRADHTLYVCVTKDYIKHE